MSALDPTSALPSLKSFSLTHILYDPSHPLSIPLTLLSLSPIFLFVSYFTLVIFNRRLSVLLLALGSIANEGLSWALKRVFKGQRPYEGLGEIGHGYGMPSSHSQAAAFLVAWGIGHAFLLDTMDRRGDRNTQTTERIQTIRTWRKRIYILGLVLWSLGVAYSRWHLLYHTPSQVIAGYAAGLASGSIYFTITEYIPLVSPTSLFGQTRRLLESQWQGIGGVGGWEVGTGGDGQQSGGWGEGWLLGVNGEVVRVKKT